jgi:small subunit ribosomal protein S17
MPQKEFSGIIVSTKMQKTVVVKVESRTLHKKYKKVISSIKKYKAHNEIDSCELGDVVKIRQTRPLSREKCWEVTNIVAKSSELT